MNIWRRDWGSPGPVPLNRTDVQESFREEFCPLLDEGGSCGDFIGQEIKISQQFMVDVAAFHTKEETDELNNSGFWSREKSFPGFLTNWAVLQFNLMTLPVNSNQPEPHSTEALLYLFFVEMVGRRDEKIWWKSL